MTTKLFLAASILVSALIAVPCFAQDTPQTLPGQERPGGDRPRGEGGPRQMRIMPLQAALDTNKDGEISAEEIANAAKALLTLDKNKDGKLSADELRPPSPPVGPTVAEMVARMMEFDTNGDKKLSKDELPDQIQSVFADADTDHDGMLTEAELTPFLQKQEADAEKREAAKPTRPAVPGERGGLQGGPPRGGRVMPLQAALDTNGDGEISAEEIASAAKSLLTLDKNGDGKISADELRPQFSPDQQRPGDQRPGEGEHEHHD